MIPIHQAIITGQYLIYLRQRASERHALNQLRATNAFIDKFGDSTSGVHLAAMEMIARRLYQRYHPFSYGIAYKRADG